MYHYKESGLDNVFLGNGYRVHETRYGEGVSISESAALHRAIGKWLILLPKPLNGAELRFLRVEMDTTQKHLAAITGATEQTLRLWEKHRRKAIPGPADRLVRILYSEFTGGDGSVWRRLERLAAVEPLEHADGCFQQAENRRWKYCASPVRSAGER